MNLCKRQWIFLDLFIKNEDFISWAEQTNIYAEQMLQRRGLLSPFARMNKWTEITGAEMKQWLGLVIATGLVEKPCMEDYWSTDPIIATPLRFLNIFSCFHLNNNTDYVPREQAGDNFDPLFKIRPLHNIANERLLKNVY